ncbi:mucin-like protein isoform X2 [Littorina saxatilis]|uniref:Mucin-like protein n=1 Tax=Littorina saxatilis TaxID=31220 RepID=A0AAN9AST0_9CAEN
MALCPGPAACRTSQCNNARSLCGFLLFLACFLTETSSQTTTDGPKSCPVFHFGGLNEDKKLSAERASRFHTTPVKIDEGLPVGIRKFKYIHIHEYGRVMFSDQKTGFRTWNSKVCSGGQPHLCVYCTPSLRNKAGDASSGVRYKLHKPSDKLSKTVVDATETYISHFKGVTFKSNSVLLVTWFRMSMNNFGNATFQAAIAVSGSESYAIVNYNEVNVLPGNHPIIDIGYSPTTNNLDQCQELLYSKTEKAFVIANLTGNTGCPGVWVYKLGEVPSNLGRACDIWYNRNLASNQSRWAQFDNLPRCPCQEERNNIKNGVYGKWISTGEKSKDGKLLICYRLSRSAGSHFYPRGKECCYNDGINGLLVQNQPDAATATAFNPSVPALRQQHLEEDRLGYDACCSRNNPSDCAKYYSLRPIGKCDPKPPIKFAWLCCDPYFLTLDEEEYLFNGWGEYTLVNLTIRRFSFILQARTDLAETDTGALTNSTIFSAFGARENDIRVFVQLDPNTKAALIIFVNDEDYSRRFKNDPDFILDEDDVLLQRKNDTVQIAFPTGISFGVSLRTKSLEVSVGVPNTFQNKTRGLLGNFNGVRGDDFLLPNGTLLTPRPSEQQIFEVFGPAWAVTANNSVMRYGPREGPSDYFHPEFVPIFLDEQTETVRKASMDLCGNNLACIYDYIAKSSEKFALESKAFKENADETNAALKNAVPVLDPPSVLRVTSGNRVTFSLRGSDLDGDTLTYHNDSYNSGVELNSATGDVSYLADKNVPVDLSFYAMDSKVRSTTRILQVIVCDCKNNGSCDFNTLLPSESTMSYYFQRATCVCPPAWDGEECELDRDGCEFSPCLKQQNCVDLTPQQQGSSDIGLSCGPCPSGYSQQSASTECLDVDECAAGSSVHGCQVTCTNTEGSYECGCGPGYRLANDGRTCQDVNECEQKTDNCEQICHNDAGGYRCSCEQGYDLQSDGKKCSQNASLVIACRNAGCRQGCRLATDSVSRVEIPQCFCFAGYDQDPEDHAACIDHDECRDNVPCNQQCTNNDGGFACTCEIGYHLAEDKVTCLHCPKLSYGANCQYTCSCNGHGKTCDPVRGCVCEKGWRGSECQEDVNECRENPDICGREVQCVNTLGAYVWKCRDGYSQNSDGICTDINECGEDSLLNNCTSLQRCVKKYDECSANVSECQQLCSNTKGSYNCDCYYGYRLNADRVTCTQVTNRSAAEQDLSCAQACNFGDEDSPFCFCDLGFSLYADGKSCDRVLTCSNFGCSHVCNATATNVACSCPAGMILDNDLKTCNEPGPATCVQFEAIRSCQVGERCVLGMNGPVCMVVTTGPETTSGDESSGDALVVGLSVGIPLAIIAVVAAVVIIMHVTKQRKKREERENVRMQSCQ